MLSPVWKSLYKTCVLFLPRDTQMYLLQIATCVVSILLVLLWWKRKNLPPGPWCLPILGYLLWLDTKAPYKTLHELAKKYGSVYGLYMGNIYTVVLTDVKIIRKVFNSDATTGRAPLFLTHGLMKGCGLICAEGDLWANQRKFVFNCLRQFGGTKIGPQRNNMEELIKKHVAIFTDHIDSLDNSTFSPLIELRHSLGSFMNYIVFGECWDRENKTWRYLQELQEEGIKLIGIAGPLNFIPILRFLPNYQRNFKFLSDGLNATHKLYDGIIENHLKILNEKLSTNPHYDPQNFLEAFLLERKRKENFPEHKFYNDQQLRYLLADMFGAGLDTTLTTINWYILYISIHKKVQTAIHEELTSLLQDKAPTMNDFQYLPLFQASVAEVQRIRSTVPLGIPHGTLSEIEIEGYTIPSNTMIIPLQWAVHMDENIWSEPDTFNPYRFLDENGRFIKSENLIPFQIGKRMCVGEELAKMLLYLYCSSILQRYELTLDNNLETVDLTGNCGITLTPNEYKINFKRYSC